MTSNRKEEAADRARSAARRVEELEERSKRLKSGEPLTSEEAAQAQVAVEQERRESERAEEHAKQAHAAAADLHRHAAALLDQAGHHNQAEGHRQAAAANEAAEHGG